MTASGEDAAPAPFAPATRSAPSYGGARQLFVRGLGLIFLIAFVSLWAQVDGLIGSHGISPAAELMASARAQVGLAPWRLPTLCWLAASDRFLHGLCALGTLAALALVAGLAPRPLLALLWALYLSFVSASDVFLAFQWDSLLLETACIAFFLAPRGFRPRWRSLPPPGRVGLFLARVLLFKLMFLSGATKLTSGDATWWGFTALHYHYWTQPLPTWSSVYANAFPDLVQRLSVAVMFFIELVLPFFVFGPRLPRLAAAAGFTFLQAAIMATGNYGFFNLLALLLVLPLVDDRVLERIVPRRIAAPLTPPPAPAPSPRWRAVVLALVVPPLLLVSLAESAGRLGHRAELPAWAESLVAWVSPFRTVNNYGLFASMTTERPEIVLEGSDDGLAWRPYEFRWKPGRLDRAPRFIAPHMPRLDWQMWFAALGNYRHNPWLVRFAGRLLEGTPEVTALLGNNPFPEHPPRYLRATIYRYSFADGATRAGGRWWQREEARPYLPVLTLAGGELRAVPELSEAPLTP